LRNYAHGRPAAGRAGAASLGEGPLKPSFSSRQTGKFARMCESPRRQLRTTSTAIRWFDEADQMPDQALFIQRMGSEKPPAPLFYCGRLGGVSRRRLSPHLDRPGSDGGATAHGASRRETSVTLQCVGCGCWDSGSSPYRQLSIPPS
jgi:hypothetical protein